MGGIQSNYYQLDVVVFNLTRKEQLHFEYETDLGAFDPTEAARHLCPLHSILQKANAVSCPEWTSQDLIVQTVQIAYLSSRFVPPDFEGCSYEYPVGWILSPSAAILELELHYPYRTAAVGTIVITEPSTQEAIAYPVRTFRERK